jgi:hypothetical protein
MNLTFLVQSSSVVWVDLHFPFCGQQHPKCRPIIFSWIHASFLKFAFIKRIKKSSEDRSGEKREGTILRARFKHLYFGNHNRTHAHIYFFFHNDRYCHPPRILTFHPQTFCMCRFHSVFMLTAFLPKLEFGRAEFRCHKEHVYNINFNYAQNFWYWNPICALFLHNWHAVVGWGSEIFWHSGAVNLR